MNSAILKEKIIIRPAIKRKLETLLSFPEKTDGKKSFNSSAASTRGRTKLTALNLKAASISK